MEGNLFEKYSNDALDITVSNLLVKGNTMKNGVSTASDPLHPDAIQGWSAITSSGTATNTNVVIDGNTIVQTGSLTTTYLQGISIFEMAHDGTLSPISVYTDIASPSFLAMSADRRFMYALSEIDDFNAAHDGCVTAFSINPTSGALTKLNVVSSGGAVPAHLSVHHSDKRGL